MHAIGCVSMHILCHVRLFVVLGFARVLCACRAARGARQRLVTSCEFNTNILNGAPPEPYVCNANITKAYLPTFVAAYNALHNRLNVSSMPSTLQYITNTVIPMPDPVGLGVHGGGCPGVWYANKQWMYPCFDRTAKDNSGGVVVLVRVPVWVCVRMWV
jgi:hypothetical protein